MALTSDPISVFQGCKDERLMARVSLGLSPSLNQL